MRRAMGFLSSLVAAAAVSSAVPASAQQAGFRVGQAVQWQAPPPAGASEWRAGLYSGVIEEVSESVRVHDLRTGKVVPIRMDTLNSVSCRRGETARVPSETRAVPVCRFNGAAAGIEQWAHLRVRLFEEVVLADGSTAKTFSSFLDSFGELRLGRGPNQFAKGQPPTPPQPPVIGQQPPSPPQPPHPPVGGNQPPVTPPQPPHPPTPPGGVVEVPEVGQAYAQALKVGYPATIQAFMTQGDYDTYLFDFAGGTFHAHSVSQLDLVADLLDAQGNMIARSRAVNGQFSFNQSLPAGRYGIIIRVMYHAGSGPYEVVIGAGSATRYRERR